MRDVPCRSSDMSVARPPAGYTDAQKIRWYMESADKLSEMVLRLQRRVDELEEKYENKPPRYRY